VFLDILEYEVKTTAVAVVTRAVGLDLEVLALEDADEEFFQAKVGIDVLGALVAGADADEFIDEGAEVCIVVEMVLVEVEDPVVLFVFGAIVIFVQVMKGVVYIVVVDCQCDALGGCIGAGVGEVDDHGLISGDDDGLAGQVVKCGAVSEVHDLFAADHAGDDEFVEGEGDVVTALVRFENI
jgi:hypothetical protein